MCKFKVSIIFKKWGGYIVQAIPPTQKSGGDVSPPPPQDLRQWSQATQIVIVHKVLRDTY